MSYTAIVKNRKLVVLDRLTHKAFDKHVVDWQGCTKCKIGEWAHNKAFVRGTLPCEILFIGEGPGQTENLTGIPFIGPAGKLLDSWIDQTLRPRMINYAITNVVLCRPSDSKIGKNRPPDFTEEMHCTPRLKEMLQIANPRMVFLMGRTADRWWVDNWRELFMFDGSRFLDRAIFSHPAYVLRMTKSGQEEYTKAIVNDMNVVLDWLEERVKDKAKEIQK